MKFRFTSPRLPMELACEKFSIIIALIFILNSKNIKIGKTLFMKAFFVFLLVISLGMIIAGLFVSGWLILIGIILLVFAIGMIQKTRCPACKQYWALHQTGKDFIRATAPFLEKDSDGKQVKYQKNYFVAHWECMSCDHKFSEEVEEKERLGD